MYENTDLFEIWSNKRYRLSLFRCRFHTKVAERLKFLALLRSHSTWVRGLKLTTKLQKFYVNAQSHSTWVRGLKQKSSDHAKTISAKSHSTWVRGLKPGGPCRL